MNIFEVSSLARGLMKKHGLGHWVFQFDRAKRRAGRCSFSLELISLSENFALRNEPADVTDTILHEIAHALVGPHIGHGPIWRAMARKIGAKPIRCYGDHINMPKGRWRATCNGCKKEFYYHRRPKYITGRYCRRCGPVIGALTFSAIRVTHVS